MVSFALSGGPDLGVLLVLFLVFNTVLAVLAGSCVYRDAQRSGKKRASYWGAFVGTLFLLNVMTGTAGLFAYLLSRS